MVERFADAALRHLGTAEALEDEGRIDDASYHYGLVGETALKAAVQRALGTFPPDLKKHLNNPGISLQSKIATSQAVISAMSSGRLGGALGSDLRLGLLEFRFTAWDLNIRYADNAICPVAAADMAVWKDDATVLFNNGAF